MIDTYVKDDRPWQRWSKCCPKWVSYPHYGQHRNTCHVREAQEEAMQKNQQTLKRRNLARISREAVVTSSQTDILPVSKLAASQTACNQTPTTDTSGNK